MQIAIKRYIYFFHFSLNEPCICASNTNITNIPKINAIVPVLFVDATDIAIHNNIHKFREFFSLRKMIINGNAVKQ